MIRSILIGLTCLSGASALAAEPVVLREAVIVDGPHVTLGDLFAVGGETADVLVARAPAPGGRTALDVNYVRQLASQHDLIWANAGGLRRVSVSRASRVVNTSTLIGMLESELYSLEGQPHQVRLANSALALHAPVDSIGGPQIQSVNFDPRSGMLSAEISPYEGAASIRVSGRAYATIDVPVLARPVASGETITAAHITWISHRADRVRADAILNEDGIVGLEARRALRPNEPLRTYDVTQPLMISRGELVTLIFESPGITLSVRARALENAADGQVARFVNLQSSRTVEALVDGPGRARVGTASTASF